jgi:hypothetical protein
VVVENRRKTTNVRRSSTIFDDRSGAVPGWCGDEWGRFGDADAAYHLAPFGAAPRILADSGAREIQAEAYGAVAGTARDASRAGATGWPRGCGSPILRVCRVA